MEMRRSVWRAVVGLTLLVGGNGLARAEGTIVLSPRATEYLHYKLFGDYDAAYVVSGRTLPRYVDGQLTAPHDGLLSPAMRGMAGRLHNDQKKQNGPSTRGAQQRLPARFTRFDDLNLAVDIPQSGWDSLEPEDERARGHLRLARSNPETILSLAVVPVGLQAEETTRSLLSASRAKIASLPNGEVLPGVRQMSARGIRGVTYRATAAFDTGKRLHYSIWVATRNGYNYSLAAYGDQAHARAVDEAMREFVGRMRLIEANRVAHVFTRSTTAR